VELEDAEEGERVSSDQLLKLIGVEP